MRPLLAAIALSLLTLSASAKDLAEDAFGAVGNGTSGPPAALGSYAKGCLAGAVLLAEDGPRWAAMRLSRGRNWGHPALIDFIRRLTAQVGHVGLPGLLIGDLGQPRGGPMKSGHRSHQIGLDVDIWLRPLVERPGAKARENWSSYDLVKGRSRLDGDLWNKSAWRAIRLASEDPAVARIFINAAIKRKLCEVTPPDDRAWLRKVRPWWGHDSHFHVRLTCPDGLPGCENQSPPPAGDGCGKELDWWFTDEPYGGTSKPPKKLTLDDLPKRCREVLAE